jgi:hypothetical protein
LKFSKVISSREHVWCKKLAYMYKPFRRAYLLLNNGTCNFSRTAPKMEAICSSKHLPVCILQVLHLRRVGHSKYLSIRRATKNLMLIYSMELFFFLLSSLSKSCYSAHKFPACGRVQNASWTWQRYINTVQ